MVDITISNKQMKPAVIHTNQFEDGVHALRFTIEDYMQGTIDLRNFKAYAVTSLKGHMDITEIPYTVSGRTMTLTWNVTSWTLKDDGVIQYQIRFSESAEDGTAVWYSYKGILVNRLSIPVDDYVSANYPTLLKQWVDRMAQLSGVIEGGESIFYMPVGQPIDVLSRVAGQLYYQIENETTNEGHFEDHLGNRIGEFNAKYISNPDINTLREHGEYVVAGTMTNAPHACTFAFVHVTDSGSTNQQLQTFYAVDSYKVHTYVRTVYNDGKGFGEWSKFATEAQLNADVTALNNEVALKQNKNIGMPNAVLVTDASGNIVASSTINVTELGALNGFLADGKGNIYPRITSLESKVGTYGWMPDYSNGKSISSGAVVPCAALGVVSAGSSGGGQVSAAINGITVWSHKCGDGGGAYAIGSFLIPAGSTVTFSGTLTYYPMKWVSMLSAN